MAQTVKNLPAMWETWVRSLGQEDPLKEGMATHSSILAWRIPMDTGASQATVPGASKSRTRLRDWAHTNQFPTAKLLSESKDLKALSDWKFYDKSDTDRVCIE